LQVWVGSNRHSAKSEGALILDIFVCDWTIFVAQVKDGSNDYANADTDSKEHAIGGEGDKDDADDDSSNDQPGGAFYVNGNVRKHNLGQF
jgi:hypothetical protein